MPSSSSMHSTARPYPRLVVTDLDGTLLDPAHKVTRRSAEALALVQKQPYPSPLSKDGGEHHKHHHQNHHHENNRSGPSNHIQVMIASGRSPRSVQTVIDQLHGLLIPDAVLCLNGSLAYNPVTRAVSFPQFIPHHALVRVVRAIRDHIAFDPPKNQVEEEEEKEEHEKALNPAVDKDDMTASRQKPPVTTTTNTTNPVIPPDQRPGFACEVIWDDQDLASASTSPLNDPTTFVCDRVWEAHRRHTIYYDYVAVDCMQTFVESLRSGTRACDPAGPLRKGRVLKLLALDRTRTAGEVFQSLPVSVRGSGHDGTSVSANGGGNGMYGSATVSLNHNDDDQEDEDQDGSEEAATKNSNSNNKKKKDLSELLAITYSGPSFIEITGAGVHKGLGLQSYCQGHGIDRRDVVAFGDWLNDFEMLTFAGISCVMGNGHPELKRLATVDGENGSGGGVVHAIDGQKNIMRVIGTNAEDGLAAEIESWFS